MKAKGFLCILFFLCLLSGCSRTEDKPEKGIDASQQSTTDNAASVNSQDELQSTPEKAILAFCEVFNSGDYTKARALMPPDFIHVIDNGLSEYYSGTINDDYLPDFMRGVNVDKFVRTEEAKDPRMLDLFPDCEKVVIYYVDISVPASDFETTGNYDQVNDFGLFACALQKGKWYVVMNEDEWR